MTDPNQPVDDHTDVPEDFASAWANVLLDIHEKKKSEDRLDSTSDEEEQCPGPSVSVVARRVQSLYNGRTPLETHEIAASFATTTQAISAVLHRAENARMIKRVTPQGWIPING